MAVQYLVLMVSINSLLKTLYAEQGIAVPILIIWVLHIKKVSYKCCLSQEENALALLMVGSASKILQSFSFVFVRDVLVDMYCQGQVINFYQSSKMAVWSALYPDHYQ